MKRKSNWKIQKYGYVIQTNAIAGFVITSRAVTFPFVPFVKVK
jgi:Na+-translocating ferredoxin:NAD+ oxidoreductase RnfG subunit